MVGLYAEAACQPSRGQGEGGRTRTIFICGQRLLGYRLVVGVAQGQSDALARQRFLLSAFAHLVADGSHVYGLSRAVDGAVGEQLRLLDGAGLVVVAEVAVAVARPAVVVALRVGKDVGGPLLVVLIGGLAPGVGGQRGQQLVAVPVLVAPQLEGGSRQGLAL